MFFSSLFVAGNAVVDSKCFIEGVCVGDAFFKASFFEHLFKASELLNCCDTAEYIVGFVWWAEKSYFVAHLEGGWIAGINSAFNRFKPHANGVNKLLHHLKCVCHYLGFTKWMASTPFCFARSL